MYGGNPYPQLKGERMSNWTHVAGIIRLDSFRMNGIPDFDKLIGKEITYDDWEDARKHPSKYLPSGSEGSLQKSVWINSKEYHISAYTVSIFGDLRDHNSAKSIIEWFKKKCKAIDKSNTNSVWIRQATITVCNERNGAESWTWSETDD